MRIADVLAEIRAQHLCYTSPELGITPIRLRLLNILLSVSDPWHTTG
jgi:hypothetical protein